MSQHEQDVSILRSLGEWWAGEAGSARNAEKIRAWYAHDEHKPERRVMVLAEVDSLEGDRRPVNQSDLQCVEPWARNLEYRLRMMKYKVEVLRDDHVVPPWFSYVPWVGCSDFGIPSGTHKDKDAHALAFNYNAPLKELDEADFKRLKHRQFSWDRDGEQKERDRLEKLFKGIMPVRRRSSPWQFSMPLTSTALNMVGLDQFMVLMYDNPEGLHRLMGFLRDDMIFFTRFLDDNQLFDPNNAADYVGAGSMGYTRSLPGDERPVRAKDRWFHVESQESVGVSPEQYGEFVFPYLKAVGQQYGRIYYGCCEPADPVIEYIRTLPNLARISISPWANEEKMGAFCRENKVVYSRKPTPNILSGTKFDIALQRDHLAKTIDCARECSLEIIQRDVYVTNNEPERFIKWMEIVREVSAGFKR